MALLMRCLVIVLLVVACLFGANSALALTVEDVPPLSEVENGKVLFVLDDAEVLSNSTEATLTKELQQLAQDKHIQVRVLTVKRIEFGQPAQEFVDQVFDKWFPTPEAKANQALLLVAVEDHRTAIAEVKQWQRWFPKPYCKASLVPMCCIPYSKRTTIKRYSMALIASWQ